MMNFISKNLLTLCLLSSSATFAYQPKNTRDCSDKEADPKALSQCLDIVKTFSDKELTTWINNQTFILEEFAKASGRQAALKVFKRSQRDFIAYRENHCRWQYLHLSPDKTATPAYKKCYIQITKNRIAELSQLN